MKHERSERAIEEARALSERFASRFIGSVQNVLLEERTERGWEGYTDHYIRTLVTTAEGAETGRLSENQIARVRLQSCICQGGEIYLKGVIA